MAGSTCAIYLLFTLGLVRQYVLARLALRFVSVSRSLCCCCPCHRSRNTGTPLPLFVFLINFMCIQLLTALCLMPASSLPLRTELVCFCAQGLLSLSLSLSLSLTLLGAWRSCGSPTSFVAVKRRFGLGLLGFAAACSAGGFPNDSCHSVLITNNAVRPSE